MRGEVDSAEAIREYAAICRQRATSLKELASSQLQRAARCAASCCCASVYVHGALPHCMVVEQAADELQPSKGFAQPSRPPPQRSLHLLAHPSSQVHVAEGAG